MKTILNNKLTILLSILLLSQFILSFKINKQKQKNTMSKNNQESTIIGTWISEEDSLWKIEFRSDSICISSYIGSTSDTSMFSISNSSPQCGAIVDVNQYTNYLQLKNLSDSTDRTCYLINGITNTHLSLSVVDRGGAFIFIKQ